MAGEQNLIPFDKRSEEEVRMLNRKGGINSGISRRRKRSMREAADLFLSLKVKDTKTAKELMKSGVDPDDIDNQMAIVAAMTIRAIAGDSRAAKVVMEMIGGAEHEEKTGLTKNPVLIPTKIPFVKSMVLKF